MKKGDRIIKFNGQKTEFYDEFITAFTKYKKRPIEVGVLRGNKTVTIPISYHINQKFIIPDTTSIYKKIPFFVNELRKDSVIDKAGFKKDDKIIRFDNKTIDFYAQFRAAVYHYRKDSVVISVLRGNDTVPIHVEVPPSGLIGIFGSRPDSFFVFKQLNYSFLGAIPAGISKGFNKMKSYLKQFKLLFNRRTQAYKSVGGFITLTKIFPPVWDWQAFWNLTAFLSLILAIMNILPIPALDGGHVTFLIYEMITGRKPSDKFLEYAQIVGMVIVFSLLIFANGNDIRKLFK